MSTHVTATRRSTLFLWLPVLVWAAVIFAFSSVPGLGTGLGTGDLVLRKLAHVSEYALLGLLLARATRRPAVAVALAAAYAVTDEIHQTFVDDREYMKAMIPHHSIAILTSERADIDDLRVCALANDIIEAQREEIAAMEWLIDDIAENGEVTTTADADARSVPEFTKADVRDDCPSLRP